MAQTKIKFRAWDIENKKMLSHEQIDQYDKDGVMHWMDIINPDNKEGVIMMQYIWLRDKDGTELYAGDIVKDRKGRTMVIDWHNYKYQFRCDDPESNFKWADFIDWVVRVDGEPSGIADVIRIGNIHENSELIKS